MTGWLTRHPTALTQEDRIGLKGVLARCPELGIAAGHVRDFGEMLSGRLGTTLPFRISTVEASYPALPASHATCSGTSTL
ncbi:hypothetical protein ACFY8W_00310 [Streptomyces sp. NPDC012637]|uniref:hypothetical protein n=1 Tax=Streptomyces sp. NPDC012637 TaxID=3364842 RepID=UPI0036E590D6